MSAASDTPAEIPRSIGYRPRPAAFVAALPPEEKHAVLLALLKAALETNGDTGLLPIDDEEGRPFGYFVPPKAAEAASARVWEEMPDEVRTVLSRPVADLSKTISADELIAGLKRAAG